jgi:hypothetical protein
MILNKTIMTLAGGLILVLGSASCSSKANTRTTANPHPQDNVVASDRMASSDRQAATDRPVPTNRTGPDDNRLASDRMIPCADQKGDATGSSDCASPGRRVGDDRAGYDSSAEAMAACPSRTDASGNVVYDDPACPSRYSQSRQQMGDSHANVKWTQESAFFDRYIGKAVKHARAGEIAGNLGHAQEMRREAQLSLDQAKEAQRAGNVPGLNEGIIALRDMLSQPEGASLRDATARVREARINLSRAGGMRPVDTQPTGALAVRTNAMAGSAAGGMNAQYGRDTRTVKGELIGDEVSSRKEGGNHYFLRDQTGKDLPITLTEDMGRHMRAGDKVEAQIDADGLVRAINKE